MLKRFGLGFAVGYVVGARSGRKGYEQLADAGQKLLEVPWIKDLVGAGQDRASEARERIVAAVRDAGRGSSQDETTTEAETETVRDDTDRDGTPSDRTTTDAADRDGTGRSRQRQHNGHATRDHQRKQPPRVERKRPRGDRERSGRGSKGPGIGRAASAVLERGRTD